LLNVEEFYAANLDGYYQALQMGLHWSYYDTNTQGSRSAPDLTPWLEYFCEMLARSALQVRQTIIERFRSAYPAVLVDPVAVYPRTFRRFLVRMLDPLVPFGPKEVAECLHVSDRTARTWLKEWHQDKLIQPSGDGVRRVRAWQIAPDVATQTLR
jgi:hypothetical protein